LECHAKLVASHYKLEAMNDQLHHAIRDAETLLKEAFAADSHQQPWLKHQAFLVVPGPWTENRCFYYSFSEDKCFSVSSDDLLTPEEIEEFWPLVEAADRAEIESFVTHHVFRLDKISNAENLVDAIWVRRWKNRAKRLLKSRLCGRGYLDRQKWYIDRHSSTASRLSHKILCSQCMQHNLEMMSLDISTAFLQGLRFTEIAKAARALGHEVKALRKVWLVPPRNVWRHLRNLSAELAINEYECDWYCLELLKAMYGLVDGPLMFQLALLTYLVEDCYMVKSLHDENYLYYAQQWELVAVIIIHVDDILLAARKEFLVWLIKRLKDRFGELKEKELPLTFIGIQHVMIAPDHLLLHQTAYLQKLNPMILDKSRKALSPCTTAEHHDFRSLVCSLLWLCLTREDLVSEVLNLQGEMVAPLVEHCQRANLLLRRARRDSSMNGLHYHRLAFPIRCVGFGDSSHATKTTVYAQEGKMTLVMHDNTSQITDDEWIPEVRTSILAGYAHVLHFSGKKGQRVSHSTSHAENVAAVGTMQITQLCGIRFTEPFLAIMYGQPITAANYIELDIAGRKSLIPCDQVTDCMDLFELATGNRGLSTDKTQRILVLSIREDRWRGLLRYLMHFPTTAMLADGLTKVSTFPQLLHFCTTGKVRIEIAPDKCVRISRRMDSGDSYTEKDLVDLKG